jgi:rRNA-processing protein FCF1
VYVLDTNAILQDVDDIITSATLFRQCASDTPETMPRFVIPWTVAWELDEIKSDSRNPERQQIAIRALNKLIHHEDSLSDRIVRETLEERQHASYSDRIGTLQNGRPMRDSPDADIFRTAFGLMRKLYKKGVGIVTNDKHLRSICAANGLMKHSARGIRDSLIELLSNGDTAVVFGPPEEVGRASVPKVVNGIQVMTSPPNVQSKRKRVLDSIERGLWRAKYWLWDDPLAAIVMDGPQGEELLECIRRSAAGPKLHVRLVGKLFLTCRTAYMKADKLMAPVLRTSVFNNNDIREDGALKFYLDWRRRVAPL